MRIEGKLFLERNGDTVVLTLHSLDGTLYRLENGINEKLLDSDKALSSDALLVLSGTCGRNRIINCDYYSEQQAETPDKGEFVQKVRCYAYIPFEPLEIVEIKQAKDISLPEAKRDQEAEKRFSQTVNTGPGPASLIGQIRGNITALNMKSPVKIIEIKNSDKQSNIKKINMIVDAETRIARASESGEPMYLTNASLKKGAAVNAMYRKEEAKTVALLITVLSE